MCKIRVLVLNSLLFKFNSPETAIAASTLTKVFLRFTPVPFPERVNRLKVDRKSTRLNSSHVRISYAVFCLKKKNTEDWDPQGVLYENFVEVEVENHDEKARASVLRDLPRHLRVSRVRRWRSASLQRVNVAL